MAYAHGGSYFLIFMAVMFGLRMFSGSRRRTMGAGRRGPAGASSAASAVPNAAGGATAPTSGFGQSGIPAGWLVDPSGRYDQRYWSGSEWTEHVTKAGEPGTDPPPGASATQA
jgi:hypothetical protein